LILRLLTSFIVLSRNWNWFDGLNKQWRQKENEIGIAKYPHGERVEREPVWGYENMRLNHQWGPGAKPLVGIRAPETYTIFVKKLVVSGRKMKQLFITKTASFLI
jgi:hypothetical protein